MNTASLARISVSLNGAARFLESGTQEEMWYKTQHREHNRFGDDALEEGSLGVGAESEGAGSYISGEQMRVVVVKIESGRISDSNETVTDFALQQDGEIPVGNHV